eukprot:8018850-Prorocentrum_lima.AAC.1
MPAVCLPQELGPLLPHEGYVPLSESGGGWFLAHSHTGEHKELQLVSSTWHLHTHGAAFVSSLDQEPAWVVSYFRFSLHRHAASGKLWTCDKVAGTASAVARERAYTSRYPVVLVKVGKQLLSAMSWRSPKLGQSTSGGRQGISNTPWTTGARMASHAGGLTAGGEWHKVLLRFGIPECHMQKPWSVGSQGSLQCIPAPACSQHLGHGGLIALPGECILHWVRPPYILVRLAKGCATIAADMEDGKLSVARLLGRGEHGLPSLGRACWDHPAEVCSEGKCSISKLLLVFFACGKKVFWLAHQLVFVITLGMDTACCQDGGPYRPDFAAALLPTGSKLDPDAYTRNPPKLHSGRSRTSRA